MAHLLDLNRREVGVGDFVLLPKVDMDSFLDNLKVRKAINYVSTYVKARSSGKPRFKKTLFRKFEQIKFG